MWAGDAFRCAPCGVYTVKKPRVFYGSGFPPLWVNDPIYANFLASDDDERLPEDFLSH